MNTKPTSLRVLDDHPGPHPADVRIDGTRVQIEMRREPMTRADWTTHDYNVHFCFGLENTADSAAMAEVEVNGGAWTALSNAGAPLFGTADPDGVFSPLDVETRGDGGKLSAFKLQLAAGQRLYVANTLIRESSALARRFDELAKDGGADRVVFGKSIHGRDLAAYHYGNPSQRGTVLVTSGFHPPEPDTLATEAIMEWLTSREGKDLLNSLSIVIVPIANPDGFALGSYGANAAGINFYWHFARELPDRCPEAAALWALTEEIRPRGYIDFHSYTVQASKVPGPYIPPLFFHSDATVRQAAAQCYQRLLAVPGTAPMTGFAAFAPHTLGSMLIKRFGTLTAAKYHLHLAEGAAACRSRGLDVFRQFTQTLIEHNLTEPTHSRRLGWRKFFYTALEWWSGLIRPVLGECRRGNWRNVRLSRTGLDDPRHIVAGELE